MAKLTDQERAELKARLDQEWWDKWWAQDFSWAGLAALDIEGRPKHPWQGWSITPDGQVMESEDPALPEGSRDATLQDYWRWNGQSLLSDENLLAANLLEDHEGQPRFHICHLPERWQDGADSWKTDAENARWTIVERTLLIRMSRSAKTEAKKDLQWDGEELIGPDRRAQLTGIQIRALPRGPTADASHGDGPRVGGAFHLHAAWSRWLEDAEFTKAEFASPTNFQSANFSWGYVYFNDAEFSGGSANFIEAQFSGGNALFYNAQFSGGHATFDKAKFSGGDAGFTQAHFSGGDADFHNAQFSGGNTDFQDVQFSGGNADFTEAQFSGGNTDFQHVQFSGGNADFTEAQFSGGNADFTNTLFSGGDAIFIKAQFSGNGAYFEHAQFSGGHADFRSAQFTGGDAYFHYAQFSGERTFFSGVRFAGQVAEFAHVQFSSGKTFFSNAVFLCSRASFSNSYFVHPVLFGSKNRPNQKEGINAPGFHHRLSFRSAEFQDTVEFRHCHFPDRAEDRQSAFAGARFKEAVDFTTLGRLPLEAFDGAILEKRLLLHSDTPREDAFRQACRENRTAIREDRAFRPARGLSRAWHSLPFTPDLPKPKKDNQPGQRGPGPRWAALEGGCRTLKRAMADAEDIHREQQFFRMELIARRHRPTRFMFWNRESPVSVFEKITSQLYGLMGDYGASIVRPVISFMAVCLLFAAFYAGWMHGAGGDPLSACDAPTRIDTLAGPLEFSFKQGFRPFFIWASSAQSPCWTESFKTAVGPLGWVGVRLVATAQSILSIALLFLTGLALRRKFQIG